MKYQTVFSRAIVFGLLLALLGASSGQVHGSPLLAPIGTAFTYQGKLIDGGAPANGRTTSPLRSTTRSAAVCRWAAQ